MDWEKNFIAEYKKVCVAPSEEQIEKRLAGIKAAKEKYDCQEEIANLYKIYFSIPVKTTVTQEFVNYFYEEDRTFEEKNTEEICILAGGVLLCLLDGDNNSYISFQGKIFSYYYEHKMDRMMEILVDIIRNVTIEQQYEYPMAMITLKAGWDKNIHSEEETFTQTVSESIVEMFKKLQTEVKRVQSHANSILEDNIRNQEKIDILSWIIGEYSDRLGKPLREIEDVQASMAVGVELSDLSRFPGAYSAESFILKMMDKCKNNTAKISLADYVDAQEKEIREKICERYLTDEGVGNTPLLSAIEDSLTVDEKGMWISAYKKKWKINPDEIMYLPVDWAKVMYYECLSCKY